MVTSPPGLSISKETPSGSGAFPDISSDIAVMISSSERGEARSWSERVVSDEGGGGVGDNGEIFIGDDISVNLAVHRVLEVFSPAVQLVPIALQDSAILGTRLDEAGLENFFPKTRRSLIRESPLPCCSATRARRSASDTHLLHQVLQAFSAAALVNFLWWPYSVFRQVMSCGGAFFKQIQASFFFLDRLRTSLVIQSGSLLLGAGGRYLQEFGMDDLKLSH